MRINKEKTKVLVISKHSGPINVRLEHEKIEQVTQLEYLFIMLDIMMLL